MYDLLDYGRMLGDAERIRAYRAAIAEAVTPGSTVADLGTGLGTLAYLAAENGASRVYAIEQGPVLEIARAIARANQSGDRISLIEGSAVDIELPETVDVVISDLHGVFPLSPPNIPSIIHAREHLLKDDGAMLPQVDTMWVAGVEAPGHYQDYQVPWLENDIGIDLRSAHSLATNTWQRTRLPETALITTSSSWATIDYRTVQTPNVRGEVILSVLRPGTCHGLSVWFDTELRPGIGFSNGPGREGSVYGLGFFPWSRPVHLEPDDVIQVNLEAALAGGQYVWGWRTSVADRRGLEKANFSQSSFLASRLRILQGLR